MTNQRALEVAVAIGDHLCASAYRHDGRCNWLGTKQRGDARGRSIRYTYETLGPDLYGGTSGVALFLGELCVRTGSPRFKEIAEGGITHALDNVDRIPAEQRYGLYIGWLGIARTAAHLGALLGRPDLTERAGLVVDRVLARNDANPGFDLLSGLAGGIPSLLDLSTTLERPHLKARAAELGRFLLESARREADGWAWLEKGAGYARPLTGLSHGAAGVGWALLELHRQTGARDVLEGAREAFRYENAWFDGERDDWPDFRLSDGVERPAPFVTTWCHGSPGIGLSRIPALDLPDAGESARDVAASVRSTARSLADRPVGSDFSLCHGIGGLGACLLETSSSVDDPAGYELVLARAEEGARYFGDSPEQWPCGVGRGSNPSLMIGFAGIGYFYLALADSTTPSVVLAGADAWRQGTTSA